MNVVADLHLHSPYSRAVSPQMTIPEMSRQAARRGISLLATGDWTHPVWIQKLEADLEVWTDGIFASKATPNGAKFILGTELSCIYSQSHRLRRVHLLVLVPSFGAVHAITNALLARGANLHADGRPILGISCIELTRLILASEPHALVIPAHAWTPWFGVLGSNGGFNSLEEAFGEFTDQIYAIETGLSSDPLMNWKVPELDTRAIVSFGDAHSPPKMGREATIYQFKDAATVETKSRGLSKPGAHKQSTSPDQKYTYDDIYAATAERFLQTNPGKLALGSTIEFYPEEGKYHWDGHRKCNHVQSPAVTLEKGVTCPVCGKPLTIGVENRVDTLGAPDRVHMTAVKQSDEHELVISRHPTDSTRPGFINLVPLQEIIAEVEGKGFGTKTVMTKYDEILANLGDEFAILMSETPARIKAIAGDKITQAIMKVRRGELHIEPGYDGEYGIVHIPLDETNPSQTQQTDQPPLF